MTRTTPAQLSAAEVFLIRVLAKTDGLFALYRFEGGQHAGSAIWARCEHFLESGVTMVSPNTKDAAERVAYGRMVGALTRADMLARNRPRGRTRGVRLTPAADEILRALCGLPGLLESFAAMQRMVAIGETDDAITYSWPATKEAPLIRETLLLDPPERTWTEENDFRLTVTLESHLAPARWRGYVETASDGYGRGYYFLTPAGLAIMRDEQAGERLALLIEAKNKPAHNDRAA